MSVPLVVSAALAAGLATAAVVPPTPHRVVARRLAPRRPPDGAATAWRGPGLRQVRLTTPVLGGAAVVGFGGPSVVPVALAVLVALVVAGWLLASGARRRQSQQTRRETVELCDALAAEMRAGQPALHAVARVATLHPALEPAARAASLGGDVTAALRRAGETPGAGGLGVVAAAWQVAEGSGAGLASTLDRVAASLRADDATAQEMGASLAPARATARLLAVLPVFGLLLGAGLGGDPLGFLLGTPAGNGCLLGGVLLSAGGIVWVERLAAGAES